MTRRDMNRLLAWLPALAAPAARAEPGFRMQGALARAALVDDVIWLAALDPAVSAPVRRALTRHAEEARLGQGIAVQSPPQGGAPLAVRLGSRIADLAPDSWGATEDAAALLWRGNGAPVTAQEGRKLLEALDYRCRIAFHTLDPEESDIHRWLEGIIRWNRAMTDYRQQLAKALAAGPEPAFADPGDPVLQLVRAARRGRVLRAGDLDAARPVCPYGRTVAAGVALARTALL